MVWVQSVVQGVVSIGSIGLVFIQQDQQGFLQGSIDSMFVYMQEQCIVVMVLGKDGMFVDVFIISSGGVVQVEVKVVEFNKIVMKQIGINFQNCNGGFVYGFVWFGIGLFGNIGLLFGMKEGNSSNEVVLLIFLVFWLVFGLIKGLWNVDVELLQSNGMVCVLVELMLVVLFG